jgi:hypothetical protein
MEYLGCQSGDFWLYFGTKPFWAAPIFSTFFSEVDGAIGREAAIHFPTSSLSFSPRNCWVLRGQLTVQVIHYGKLIHLPFESGKQA